MARSIGMAAEAAVFRAVLVLKYPDREPFAKYEGPYGEKAAAKARVTFWRNHLGALEGFESVDEYGHVQDTYADGHVERGEVTWTKV